jgi:hypothetical protein
VGARLKDHPWIGFDTEHAALARQLAQFLPEVRPVVHVNSVAAAIAAARVLL